MNNDDINLHNYQDDLTADDNVTDPIMSEENDDPTEELGIPVEEFKTELDKQDFGNKNDDSADDDEREYFEDLDEDSGDNSYR